MSKEINKLFFFTGTGNSLQIAKDLKEIIPEIEVISITKFNTSSEITADSIGFVFPVYFMDIPDYFKAFLKKVTIKDQPYIYGIGHFGVMYGNSFYTLNKILKAKGKKLSAYFPVVMPDNSIAYPSKKEKIPLMFEEEKEKIKTISDFIINKKVNFNHMFYRPFSKILATFSKLSFKIYYHENNKISDEKKCTLCGSCVKLCPVNNIVLENNKITFKDKCVWCFACIQWCPTSAIEFGRLKINEKVHYVNPHIKMSEIFDIHQ